jgi:hypothetical protein
MHQNLPCLKAMLVSSRLGACGPPYSLVYAPCGLAYAEMNNTYMMQFESSIHKLCCNWSEKIYTCIYFGITYLCILPLVILVWQFSSALKI